MKNSMLFLFAVLVTLTHFSCSSPPEPSDILKPFPNLSGPFLGQTLPDSVPELFAPDESYMIVPAMGRSDAY